MSDARSAIRIMAIRVRDIRLAQENVDITAAVKGIEEQQALANKLIQQSIPKVLVVETRNCLEKVAATLDEYAAVAKQVAGIRSKVMGLDVGSVRLVTADEEARAYRCGRILTPVAGKLNEAIDKAAESAKDSAAVKSNAEAAATSRGTDRPCDRRHRRAGDAGFGGIRFAVALPPTAARWRDVLVELTHDRIVDVPFTAREDEIGDSREGDRHLQGLDRREGGELPDQDRARQHRVERR